MCLIIHALRVETKGFWVNRLLQKLTSNPYIISLQILIIGDG
ncbi:hypothetical protein CWATWH0003_4906 [Crocosphaera watsonii WH 0003]|uniref:Uncharacterized protein n=1 Tax=Crocosphaera watsonii WH 0003 TaxID=423471 RepID=G5JBU2_CROWT|nr:hypothetical protein CWATWH0003_4906 [Crocosphaera watsonii WH 0003]